MSDYSKTTNFTAKDSLASGDPNKVIKGSEHDTEFDNIATAVATKANKVSSPTTNNLAMLTATGDIADSSVETDASGNITANVTGNLTGNVTGNVTGASTVDVDTITADTTNGDLNLARNGTGDITVDSVPIYGLVVLDTPEVLVSASSTTGSWQTVNSTTLNTAGAVKAIIRVVGFDSSLSGTAAESSVYLRKTGSALAAGTSARVAYGKTVLSSAAAISTYAVGESIVNLDASSDFDWYHGVVAGTATCTIILVGYYT